jgi:rRNA biogenesis protein RRP5
LSAGFVWDDDRSAKMSAEQPSLLDGAVEAEMEPAGGQTSRKGRRAQEAAAARDEEAAIAAREAELGSAPRSAEDFERLLLGSPNSSYMWMRYISFQLNLTEIERARQVGERALRTIALTEHKERFNIHAALLNLEKAHGDEETLAAAVARALQGCDPKQVYLHVASMHERAGDALLADAAFEVAAKKFRPHSDVWIAWMTALMARGVPAQAKAILQRAVDALPRASHVEVISKFAQLEFRYGLPERGRTVFDGVLANYPKRVDVWSIYIDMQLRQAEPESTRRLFERVTSLRLSSKKMKYFFSRYLKYARESGDAQLVAHVKEKARAWVESAAGDREPPK